MSLRTADNIADIISSLRTELDELKARQFTSQDSGMLFKQTVGPTATVKTTGGAYECFYINTTFTPKEDGDTIYYPTFTLSANEYGDTLHIVPSEYASYIYDIYASGWDGYYEWTLYHFFHLISKGADGSITWQSLIYNDGASGDATFQFTPIISASDSGTITNTVGRFY